MTPRVPLLLLATVLLTGCATQPPRQQHDLCAVFDQHPEWYGYAKKSEKEWGTPVPILMSFIRHESSFRQRARPPRNRFLFIPLGRKSSAKGYGQIQDPVWGEYKEERGGLLKRRSSMEDVLDFIGWYNHKTHQRNGVAKTSARELYLAYHEGHGGYRRGSFRKKPEVQRAAARVAQTASDYRTQLGRCEDRFKCSKWYQIWPFCS